MPLGAIPDEEDIYPNERAATAAYTSSSADPRVAAATAPQRPEEGDGAGAASFEPRQLPEVPKTREVDKPTLRRVASDAVKVGLNGIERLFNLSRSGGMPTEEDEARIDQGAQRMANGEGAATRKEVQAIDYSMGLEDLDTDEGMKNLVRIDKVVNYYLQMGDKDSAEAAAASLLLYGQNETRNAAKMAAVAFEAWQDTGDPQDLRNATNAIKRAHQMIPDGIDIDIDVDPETRQIVATMIDENGQEQSQVVDPAAIPELMRKGMDNSMYWKSMFQIAQPRLAEIDRTGERKSEFESEKQEYQEGWDAEKRRRAEEYKIAAEERGAAREQFRFERGAEHGATLTERQQREFDAFYDDWAQRYQEAGTPEEKKALAEEGLAYRYENTPDRRTPVESGMMEFSPESPFADTFDEEDLQSLRNIAGIIARKNAQLDAPAAMEMAAALVTTPNLANNPDGTLNVDNNWLVFNPALLPTVSQLRQKYRANQ
jgi:hypothetical protein